jgi:hypothetical protein
MSPLIPALHETEEMWERQMPDVGNELPRREVKVRESDVNRRMLGCLSLNKGYCRPKCFLS